MCFILIGIGIAGAVGSAAIASGASNKATSALTGAAQQGINYAENNYGQFMANNAPIQQGGTAAFNALLSGFMPGGQFTQGFNPGNFAASPEAAGMAFTQNNAISAIDATAAQHGQATNGKLGGLAAPTSNAIATTVSGIADTTYQSWLQQAYSQYMGQQQFEAGGLQSLAVMGQTAIGEQGSFGMGTANSVISGINSTGNALAKNAVNQGNIGGSLLGSVTGLLGGL